MQFYIVSGVALLRKKMIFRSFQYRTSSNAHLAQSICANSNRNSSSSCKEAEELFHTNMYMSGLLSILRPNKIADKWRSLTATTKGSSSAHMHKRNETHHKRFQRNVSNSLFYKTFHRRRRRHYRKLTKTLHPKISSREIRAGCQDQRILHVQGSSVSFHDCVCGYILGRSERLE
jgi:hypothetical protein